MVRTGGTFCEVLQRVPPECFEREVRKHVMGSNYTRPSRISRPLRTKIFDRDGRVCVYRGSSENLSVDHILAEIAGWRDLNTANVDVLREFSRYIIIRGEV